MKVRFGIRQRILLAFLLLAFTGVAFSLWDMTVLLDNRARMEHIHSKNLPALIAAYEISRQSESIAAAASSLITKHDKWSRGNFLGRIADQFNWIDVQLGIISKLGYDADKINKVKKDKLALQNSFNNLSRALEKAENAPKSTAPKNPNGKVAANKLVERLLLKHKRCADLMNFSVADLTSSVSRRIDKMVAEVQTSNKNEFWQLALYSVGATIFALLVVLYMDTNVGRRIVDIQQAMSAVANGDRGEKIPHSGNDEISDMGIALRTFVKKLEEREELMRENHRKAVRANKAKSEFLAAMSHDLRTPINAIMGFSDIMRLKIFGPLGSPRYEEYANDINNSGEHLISLINNILDLSRVEAGKHKFNEKNLDIAFLVQSSVKMVETMAKEQKLHITTDIEGNLPMLRGDDSTITQIFNNLLSNAVKFTPEYGKITICARLDIDRSINVLINDTGCGMSEHDITRALKPFEQVNGIHSGKHKGTGLGLHICVNLMKLFDGKMEIESEIGRGTTVILRFSPERTIYAS